MDINLNIKEEKAFRVLAEAAAKLNVPAWVVGGYVRDKLLGRGTKDIDIVCVGDGIELAHQFAELLSPKPKVHFFKNFGTAMLRYEDTEYEFVGARKESYSRDSRKPVVEPGTITDDQNRRDFTINTLAISLNSEDYGSLVDPFGGQADLKRGLIKTPLDPDITFSDDPLRMMRAIRFATQLEFTIEFGTLQAIARNASRIKIISQERITVELEKILASRYPSIGFRHLFETGLLQLIFPEMAALKGAQTQDGYQHKDNFYHTLKVIDNICEKTDNIWLRWAALLHDIGKPVTKRYEKDHGWTFHGHEVVGAKMVVSIFNKLKLPLDHKMRYVQGLVRLHQRPVQLTKEAISDSALRRLLFEAGEDIDDLMILCQADITSRNKDRVTKYMKNYHYLMEQMKEVEAKDHLRQWQPPISGEMIMSIFGIPPSKVVGVLKTTIREAILEGEIGNNYDEAYQLLVTKAAALNLKPIS